MRNPLAAPAWMLLLGALACSGKVRTTEVPPALSVSPATLDFGLAAVGSSAQAVLSLQAQTNAPVEIAHIAIVDESAAAFTVSAAPSQVPGSGSTELTVTFAPAAVQSYTAKLVIQSNDASRPSQEVALTGRGGERALSVSLEDPPGATAVLATDGGLGVSFIEPFGGSSGTAWPQVLIANAGSVGANLTGFHFSHGDAGFFLPTLPTVPQSIAPEQVRALELAFAPPAGNASSTLSDALTLEFDDARLPSVTLALNAEVALDQPPTACAFIDSAQELDGTVQHAAVGPVQVEPGARVQLTAFADDLGDAGNPACSYDPEDGRTNLAFRWSVASAPPGSRAGFSAPGDPRPVFVPDLAGDYSLAVQVQDAQGASATASVSFSAAPLEDLTAVLTWPGQPQVDLDLHLVRPGGRPFASADDISSLTLDGGHDWGALADPTDNPHFSGDDQGDGDLLESTWLNRPQDGCLQDGGCSYGVWVHYFQDRRALDGGSCGQTACLEGLPCGCNGGDVCEPGPGGATCAAPVTPQVEIFLKGQSAPALTVPLDLLELPSPCFTWHAVDVSWWSDGGVAVLAASGDGGAVAYWGDHTNTIRECVPGAGGYAPSSPPLLQP